MHIKLPIDLCGNTKNVTCYENQILFDCTDSWNKQKVKNLLTWPL